MPTAHCGNLHTQSLVYSVAGHIYVCIYIVPPQESTVSATFTMQATLGRNHTQNAA